LKAVYGGDAGKDVWVNATKYVNEKTNANGEEPTPETLLKKMAWSTLGIEISFHLLTC
jgi:hypothetical protein